jgi:geranylgeranyl diphosphate synthase type II
MDTSAYIKSLQNRSSAELRKRLAAPGMAPGLEDAMQYAVHNGGKRIRPVLAYAAAETVGGTLADADNCACAVELIHAYSLVHDDLPAMDDDALRRGQPTCHIRFGEATAILAGDALQSLAFEVLTKSPGIGQDIAAMVSTLAQAAGWLGMVAGQSIDIDAAGTLKDESELARMHRLKTGALINASVRLGALSTGRATMEQLHSLATYAGCIGHAFQIKDDILDVEGDTAVLGKQQGKDQSLNKPTYTSLLGLEAARQRLQSLYEEGIAALSGFGGQADRLKAIAAYIIDREN